MKNLAKEVMEKHNTRNPYEIARKENIVVVIEELGNVFGYYNQVMGQKFIHVNESLPAYFQSYVVAHMLYAAFTNNEGMQFLKEKAAAKFIESEKAANQFAIYLAFGELDLAESLAQRMKDYGLTEEDILDLSDRLKRIWDIPDDNLGNQLRIVLKNVLM